MRGREPNPVFDPVLVLLVLAMTFAASCSGARAAAAPPPPPPAAVAQSQAQPPAQPVVLDHVVAVINGDVLLESDVREEMRFAVLQPERANPSRNTPQSALRRLIDRDLILQQMKSTQSRSSPATQQEVDRQISDLRKQIPDCAQYHCETDAGWRAFLDAHGLTASEVEAHWRQRMLILAFIQSRFGAGVRISKEEVAEYYKKNLEPEFAKRKLNPPPLETVAGRIQEILLQQRVNLILQDWLRSLKGEGSVSILSPEYAEVGNGAVAGAGGAGANP